MNIYTWPDEKTERTFYCPFCGSNDVYIKEERLVDWLSSPPSGYWRMNKCNNCEVGYLSKRPRESHIKEAYANYYTHSAKSETINNSSIRSTQKFFFDNFCQYSSSKKCVTSFVFYYISRIFFPLGLKFDSKSRHIFKSPGGERKLLDVGCGNGEFLELAKHYGWDVSGIDFDIEAVKTARLKGLDVIHGGIKAVNKDEKYDYITLSHVIEHVYNPAEFLQSCIELLNKGGVLWLETPNIESIGYSVYKSNWRGLEPPRHLIIFNSKVLINLLRKSGMSGVTQKCHGFSSIFTTLASEVILDKSTPCGSLFCHYFRLLAKIFKITIVESIQLMSKKRREFITLISTKDN